MCYIFMNPVVRQMYEKNQLEELLKKNGYEIVEVRNQWDKVVREKYRNLISQTEKTVLDARCPLVFEKLQNYLNEEDCLVADIHPILIHCAIELAEREDLSDRKKIITTPCSSLATYGNALHLKNTEFVSWKDLAKNLNINENINENLNVNQNLKSTKIQSDNVNSIGKHLLSAKKLEKSPIPLGFFEKLEVQTDCLSGADRIESYFQKEKYRDTEVRDTEVQDTKVKLVEMLWCEDGCISGDGV